VDLTVETVIGNLPRIFRLPPSEQRAIQLELIVQSFAHHYERNGFYRAQCDAAGLTVYDLERPEDLVRLPLIPLSAFKSPSSHVLLSVPLDEIELEIKSTGTSGVPSVTRRDATTLDRVSLAITGLYREFFRISRGAGLYLAPSLAENPEMSMVKVINYFSGLLSDARYVVRDYSFEPAEAIQYLRSFEGKEPRHIIGPPFLIDRLLRHLEAEDLRLPLDAESFVITIGGWKRFTGEYIGRDQLHEKIERYLGLAPARVRDMYGMGEANMLAIECEHHHKHIPPWVHASIRSLDDHSKEAAPQEEGVIALLDPTSRSYPGFLLSEDVGSIPAERCACGREGPIVLVHRRVEGTEYGCCAVSLEKFIESQEIVRSCRVDAA